MKSCCTSKTNTMLYANYISIKPKRKKTNALHIIVTNIYTVTAHLIY